MLYRIRTFTLHVQNFHPWLTHMPAVSCCCLLQRCQWLSPTRQTKLAKVHLKTLELMLTSVAAFNKTPAFPPSLII